mmetsp:Transcript_105602/g.227639  ORF Transcript_105602/g.227639 Transcript_105602/m.227639 type:complete len:95 (+) Transcript_105602:119-403(+)|eukprot:CAMPEP_0116977636 /NCGR_PEP_ID=MMETSP0467-20121206/57263_1 /TAXON_ID=283647 /ORGANISM="Mesodinium pulex, Strain SPMC105" /LENGTH=94 /DNA_ID=CAMNT_0004670771 /DNA_START=102 /DNA_END=386 /DNA_ORIENTATION=-
MEIIPWEEADEFEAKKGDMERRKELFKTLDVKRTGKLEKAPTIAKIKQILRIGKRFECEQMFGEGFEIAVAHSANEEDKKAQLLGFPEFRVFVL